MKLAYKTFLVDTGLGGNVFNRDYKKLHRLAGKCWFQHLWCLCDFLQVKVVLNKAHHVQPIREGDRCLMDAVIDTGRFKGEELVIIGICRKFKAVHMILCLVRCDGKEIRAGVMDKHKEQSLRKFPQEQPTAKMLTIWNNAIASIANNMVNRKGCINNPLRRFL